MLVNGERALAYPVIVEEIKPIPNYDRVSHGALRAQGADGAAVGLNRVPNA